MTHADTVHAHVSSRPRPALLLLARIEGQRMLRHPLLWVGLAATAAMGYQSAHSVGWTSSRYELVQSSVTPLLLGISLVAAQAFSREHSPLGEDTPLGRADVSVARLLGGLSLVAVTGGVVAGAAILITRSDLVTMGDVPGRTVQGYAVPELVQPVLLAAFAVALAAAVGHWLSSRLAAAMLLVVFWLMVGPFEWIWNQNGLRLFTPLQVQPIFVDVGPGLVGPDAVSADWVLAAPNDFQPGWDRLIVSPALAAWHDLYLLGLTTLLVAAVTFHPRLRWLVLAAGTSLVTAGLLLQGLVAP